MIGVEISYSWTLLVRQGPLLFSFRSHAARNLVSLSCLTEFIRPDSGRKGTRPRNFGKTLNSYLLGIHVKVTLGGSQVVFWIEKRLWQTSQLE